MTREERYMSGLREALEEIDEKQRIKMTKAKAKAKAKAKVKPKKPESIINLQKDYLSWRIKQDEDCSQPRGAIFSDENANELTKAIVAHIYCNGGFAARINSTGIYKQSEGRFIKSGSRNGMADVNACIKGKHIQIEIKVGSDKPRAAQLQVQKEVEKAGGIYIFVKTFDDYLEKSKDFF